MRRVRRVLKVGVALSMLASVPVACILADPLPQERNLPTRRPSIVHHLVTPPPSEVLLNLPGAFDVAIQLANPTARFEWQVFVDYDPIRRPRLEVDGSGGGSSRGADFQFVHFSIDKDRFSEGVCHKIEFLIALDFVVEHIADSAGADSITWLYAPKGDFSKCTPYDGGGDDGSFSDASPGASP